MLLPLVLGCTTIANNHRALLQTALYTRTGAARLVSLAPVQRATPLHTLSMAMAGTATFLVPCRFRGLDSPSPAPTPPNPAQWRACPMPTVSQRGPASRWRLQVRGAAVVPKL